MPHPESCKCNWHGGFMMFLSNEDADLTVYPLHSQGWGVPWLCLHCIYPSSGDITERHRPLPLTKGFAPSPTLLHRSGRELASGQQSASLWCPWPQLWHIFSHLCNVFVFLLSFLLLPTMIRSSSLSQHRSPQRAVVREGTNGREGQRWREWNL